MRVNMGREGRTSSSLSANGGSMLGALILANGPSQPLEAATKYYVDSTFASLNANNVLDGVLPISSLPGFTGDATSPQGSNVITLTNLGVSPGSYAKVIVDAKGRVTGNDILTDLDIPVVSWNKVQNKPNTLEGYGITDALNITGGVFSGHMSVPTPTNSMSAVNKQYVDAALSGNSAVVGDIIRKPFATTPTGFLRCNGAEVDKTTYADLYAVIGDTFSNYLTIGSGQPWRQQYQINETQSGDITGWTTGTALLSGLSGSSAIVTKNRVYLLGGWITAPTSIVYTAPINADGTLGTWASSTSLPVALNQSQAIVTKNRVYLLGGHSSGGYISTIYTTPINSDGTLGTWVVSGSLPTALSLSKTIITKNRVYLLGGTSNGSDTLSDVYTTTINSDGTLGTWGTGIALPNGITYSSIIVTKNRVYLLGGHNGTAYTSTVYTAPINSDGTLGTWTTGSSLPGTLGSSSIFITKNRVYLLGGSSGSSIVSTVYTALINSDGTLGTWTTGSSLPSAVCYSSSIITKNRVYLLGGYNGSALSTVYTAPFDSSIQDYSPYYAEDTTNYMMPGSGKPWQQQYQINETQSTDITGWTTGTALLENIYDTSVIVTKNRVYILGGYNGSTCLSTVYTAPINSDGTLGTWATGISLPITVNLSKAIIVKNKVYLIGGHNDSIHVSDVYTAPINADGTLGTWTTSNSLPGGLSCSQAIVTKNRIYLIGGSNNSGYSSLVYTVIINSDGTLGTWTTGVSLPGNVAYSHSVVTKNRVYLLGGGNGNYLSTIYTATISSDGIIGIWYTSGTLPTGIGFGTCINTKNRVYIIGGVATGGGVISAIYSAPINADGTLGTWVTNNSLPVALYETESFIVNNKVYVIGGRNVAGSATNNVYMATISEGLNDYSPYYDGSIVPVEPINPTTLFALPDFSAREKNGVNFYIKF